MRTVRELRSRDSVEGELERAWRAGQHAQPPGLLVVETADLDVMLASGERERVMAAVLAARLAVDVGDAPRRALDDEGGELGRRLRGA